MTVRVVLLAALVVAALASTSPATAHDVPDRLVVHLLVRPEAERLVVLARWPLILAEHGLPKRGGGYLDLAAIGPDDLERTTRGLTAGFTLFADGGVLEPDTARARISSPTDRSFRAYEEAARHLDGSPLPASADVYWNDGFLDARLEYPTAGPAPAASANLALEPHLTAGSEVVELLVRFVPVDGATRTYRIHGDAGRVTLDPRWFQAATTFLRTGVHHILTGLDHLLFLLVLVLPFRGQLRSLLGVVTAFTIAHSVTLVAAALGAVPSGQWFGPLVETVIAASIVYMAVENVVAANLQRRWLITAAFGLVHGFGFASGLQEEFQFAGAHLALSLATFNVGVELGQLAVLVLLVPLLAVAVRTARAARMVLIVLSVLVGHTAWHWMMDRSAELRRFDWSTVEVPAAALAGWSAVALLLALAAWLLLGHHAGGGDEQPPSALPDHDRAAHPSPSPVADASPVTDASRGAAR